MWAGEKSDPSGCSVWLWSEVVGGEEWKQLSPGKIMLA